MWNRSNFPSNTIYDVIKSVPRSSDFCVTIFSTFTQVMMMFAENYTSNFSVVCFCCEKIIVAAVKVDIIRHCGCLPPSHSKTPERSRQSSFPHFAIIFAIVFANILLRILLLFRLIAKLVCEFGSDKCRKSIRLAQCN